MNRSRPYRRDMTSHRAVYGEVDRGQFWLCQNCLEGWDDSLPPHRCPDGRLAGPADWAPEEEPGPVPTVDPPHGRTITLPGDDWRKRYRKIGWGGTWEKRGGM